MPQDAFISYSHAADGELAPAIESGLERLAKPWYRRRALSVFRDSTGLSVSPHLWTSISTELDQSRKFILLASPRAADSPWVERELERWLESKSVDDILIVLTDGTLAWDGEAGDFDEERSDALPSVLVGAFAEEPLHLDLSWARTESDLNLRHPRFREEIAKLAAAIHGKAPDDLIGDDIREHRRALRLAWGAASGLLVLLVAALAFGVYALDRRSEAFAQRDAAQSRALAAQSLLQLTSDPELSVLVGMEAARVSPSRQAVTALRRAIDESAVRDRFEYGSPVADVAFVAGGDVVAVGRDGQVVRWNRQTGEESWRYAPSVRQAGAGGLRKLIVQGRVVIAVLGHAIVLLNEATGETLRTFAVNEEISAASLARDGRTLALAVQTPERGRDVWYAVLRDLGSGDVARNFWGPSPFPHAMTALAFHPSRNLLAIGRGAKVDLVDTATGKVVDAGILEQADEISELAFSRTGDLLASAGSDGALRIWSFSRQLEVREIRVPGRGLQDLAFSPTDPRLATAGIDGVARTWDVDESRIGLFGDFDTGEELRALRGHEGLVEGVAYSPDGDLMATASLDGTVRVWDTRPESQRLEIAPSGYSPSAVAFSPSEAVVAIATDEGIEFRDASSGDEVLDALSIEGGSASIAYHPNDDRVIAAVTAETLELVRLPRSRLGRGTTIRSLRLRSASVLFRDVAFSADGEVLAFVDDGEARLWELDAEAEPVGDPVLLRGHSEVTALAFGPDGLVATASWDGTAKIWDSRTAEERRVVGSGTSRLFAVAFSPDGELVATSGLDGAVRVWQTDDGAEIRTLRGHQGAVQDLVFSPDGRLIASAGSDRTVRIWEMPSGQAVRVLNGHSDTVATVAFDHAGSVLASGGFDGRVRIWDPCPACFDADDLVELATGRVTRDLELAERATFVDSP